MSNSTQDAMMVVATNLRSQGKSPEDIRAALRDKFGEDCAPLIDTVLKRTEHVLPKEDAPKSDGNIALPTYVEDWPERET